jgi:4-hydroxy-2-oxoheptanedioate aldolase
MRNRVRELLVESDCAAAVFVTLTDPTVVELAALAGFDLVVLECEHGTLSLETVRAHARAARAMGIGVLARVPAGDWGFVQRALDAGVDGILAPHVSDVEGARRAVASVRYPPLGARGMSGTAPSADFGAHGLGDLARLTAWQDASTVLAVMIEDVAGVEEVDRIVEVTGIDVVWVGPADLAASAGAIGRPDDPVLRDLVDRVFAACRRASVKFGMPIENGAHPRTAAELRAAGAWLLSTGADSVAILQGLHATYARTQSV